MKGRAWLVAVAVGCSHPAPNATPESAVRAWLEHMEDSSGDPLEAKEAYALLGPRARANLEARAARASQVEGRRAQPFEMLADGRFGLKFRPKAMHATVNGTDAVVDVTGDDPRAEYARVVCVKEGGGWRVELEVPEVSALPRRVDGGT
jgi:hypothetical protein